MSEAGSESAKIELLTRMIEDQRRGALGALEDYARELPEEGEYVARSYLRLVASSNAPELDEAERLGEYELVRELGRGGQATVWLARDPRLDREVALKVVPRPGGAALPRRLEREAQVGARWTHPSLCPVLDAGADERQAWLAMRYVSGEPLDTWAEERRPWRAAVELAEALARGLAEAHASGVVHRDVKPSNVIVQPDGVPVLVDFGVAALEEAAPLTMTGDAVGTPAYMAPEQLDPKAPAPDARADVWSLGVTLFEVLAGVRPFDEPTRDRLVRAIRTGTPAQLGELRSELPRDLCVVIETAMARDLGQRYASAGAFADELVRVLEGRPIRARRAGLARRATSWAKRDPALAGALGVALLALGAGLGTSLTLLDETRSALDAKEEALDDVGSLLGEVTRLSDRDVTTRLIEDEPTLWPAHPRREPDLVTWLGRADDVLSRQTEHRAAREAFVQRSASPADGPDVAAALGVGRLDDATGSWLLSLVDAHLADLDRLAELRAEISARLERARTLENETVTLHSEAWARAAQDVAADERFEGLALEPQVGLVPLGADPSSGLQEFAVHGTGEIPERAPENGALTVDGQTAVVLILVPGGLARCGVDRPTEDRPEGTPFVDARSLYQEGPHHECELAPFLIGKYEVTQGQWERHEGNAPSTHTPARTNDKELVTDADAQRRLPVETISWNDATRVAAELGLVLPTETQWEYGARAGTETSWWTGDDPALLANACNVADRAAQLAVGPQARGYDTFLDDGWIGTSFVGSFRANPWGLHDVIGNVSELCAGTMEDWHHVKPVPPIGEIPGATQTRAPIRGGGYGTIIFGCRMAARLPIKKDVREPSSGVRFARLLDE